ncbi:MAG: hypothetical protein MUF69_03440, partial [Desulfobacterota bacterium]|nr:hypothetical protein [Thermodesulfobacteriota bacterium]
MGPGGGETAAADDENVAAADLEEIGRVTLEFDLAPTQGKLAKMRARAIFLIFLFLVLGVFVTNVVVRLMFAGLNRAVAALAEIASGGGNLSKKLVV